MGYIWALDLSLSNSGISIFTHDGKFVFISSVETNTKDETCVRLHKIGQRFLDLKKEYKPDKIIIEKGFHRFNVSTEQVYRVVGVVEYLFWDIDKIYYPATTVKKEVTGKGNSKKFEVEATIIKNFPNARFKNLDESDSFAVGLTYFYKEGILKNNG
jgi:Holliday junction resolvasome RuvABC endonuclease subunit